MTLSRWIVPVAGTLATIAAVSEFRPVHSRAESHGARDADATEIRRIRVHFDSVLRDLSQRDVRALTSAQRSRRSAVLETISAYRDRGIFPHNYDFPGLAVPYFVDRKTGTLCAVAHLLAATGRRDIVDRVARTNNNVWVPKLANDTAFASWLRENGLTLDEAAFIQVPYAQPTSSAQFARDFAFIIATPFALAGSMTTSIWNLKGNSDGHRRWVSGIGLVSGVVSTAAAYRLVAMKPTATDAVQLAGPAAAVGMTSIALSVHSMYRHHGIVAAEREAARRAIAEATIAPMLSPDHSRGGLAVSLRF